MQAASVMHMRKRYGDKLVVDDIRFAVKEGECFGILGHNGAGKTTLVELMLGLKKPDEGSAFLLGNEMSVRKKQLFEEIGAQLQYTAYQPKIRVGELCEERAVLYRKPISYQNLLAYFSLADKLKQPVETLSGGEKQKLSVLLALMHDPKLIFLDELTTGLDTVARHEIWRYLLDIKKQGKSLILTSHYMDEVEMLCDHVLILKHGKEVIQGSVADVIANSPYESLEEAYLWYMGEENLL